MYSKQRLALFGLLLAFSLGSADRGSAQNTYLGLTSSSLETSSIDNEATSEFLARARGTSFSPARTGFGTAQSVSFSNGRAVVSGEVGTGQDIFVFSANQGAYVTLDVNVTAELQGTEYRDDDSHLFLFDSNGVLVAENDDDPSGGYESLINRIRIPATGRYFAVVTTYGNEPIYSGGRLTGWTETGKSRIRYNLTITRRPGTGAGDARQGLGNARPVSFSNGRGVVSGEVGTGQNVFVFPANQGAYVTLDVNVTAELQGTEYRDDDSHLFLFDSNGVLVAENDDDSSGYESLLNRIQIPTAGQYYAVVTTYGNNPIYSGNRLTGWSGTGKSRIRYNLVITRNQ